jgi:hypothetical protein
MVAGLLPAATLHHVKSGGATVWNLRSFKIDWTANGRAGRVSHVYQPDIGGNAIYSSAILIHIFVTTMVYL